jgi:hypothetical protein
MFIFTLSPGKDNSVLTALFCFQYLDIIFEIRLIRVDYVIVNYILIIQTI